MHKTFLLTLILALCLTAQAAGVRMEKVAYGGWPNCVRLSNGETELVVTTDVGPRIIRFGFVGGQNLLKEYADQLGRTGGEEWRIYGGHRVWHAPEAKPRTYSLDNGPVDCQWDGTTLKLTQPIEPDNRIQKAIDVTLAADGSHVRILHRLINRNPWAVELAPWALTVMAQNGRAIFPQESYRPHTEFLLAARPLVLWHYTDMADPRFTWGTKYIQFRQDPNATSPQKLGFRNTRGWLAYTLNGDLFMKRYSLDPEAAYPDFGCNTESFTNEEMLELETLGPMTKLAPNGGEVEHIEHWFLFKADVGEAEADIDANLLPLVRQTDAVATP